MTAGQLLCSVGIHHPLWVPEAAVSGALNAGAEEWLRIRTCARCGQGIAR
jgi:hypothetical protein